MRTAINSVPYISLSVETLAFTSHRRWMDSIRKIPTRLNIYHNKNLIVTAFSPTYASTRKYELYTKLSHDRFYFPKSLPPKTSNSGLNCFLLLSLSKSSFSVHWSSVNKQQAKPEWESERKIFIHTKILGLLNSFKRLKSWMCIKLLKGIHWLV